MANKFLIRVAFIILLVFVFATPKIYPQVTTNFKHVFTQRLEWKQDSNAYQYKVEIRNSSGKTVKEFTTDKNIVEFSFPSGDYEYKVTAYDFLGRESTKTEWKKFTIKKAIEPNVKTVTENIVFDDEEKISVPVETKKVQEGAKVELVDTKTGKTVAGTIENDKAVFDRIPDGDYIVKITNPGGLVAESAPVNIREKTEGERAEERRIAEEKRLEEERRIAEEKRLEEERRLAEERRIAEEKRLEEERRIAEEKRLEEERKAAEKARIAEEKRLAKEARRNRPPKNIFLMAGAYYPFSFKNSDLLLDKKVLIGAALKFEVLPIKISRFRMGFNLQIAPLPVVADNSFSDEYLIFMPVNLNLSFYIPLYQEKIWFGVEAGGGGVGLWHIEKYYSLDSEYERESINNIYINYMYDGGIVFRFIPKKHFTFDITARFENWRVGDENIMLATGGLQIGWRW